MTRSITELLSEVDDADPLLFDAIAEGVDAFVSSNRDRAVVDWRIYRIAEWSRQLASEDRARMPTIDWTALGRLRILLAHHFHTIRPELMFVFVALHVPKLQHALRTAAKT